MLIYSNYKTAQSLISVSGPPFFQKLTRPPDLKLSLSKVYTVIVMHLRISFKPYPRAVDRASGRSRGGSMEPRL